MTAQCSNTLLFVLLAQNLCTKTCMVDSPHDLFTTLFDIVLHMSNSEHIKSALRPDSSC